MPTPDAQRDFLEAITDDAQPVQYCAHGLTHSVYVTRLAQLHPFKFEGRDEPVFQVTMVATASEATGHEAQTQFLLSAANDVAPLVYTDVRGDRHYVIMTRLVEGFPYKDEDRFQPIYTITMADARAVLDVQGVESVSVAETLTAASLFRTVALWDAAATKWEWFQWE